MSAAIDAGRRIQSFLKDEAVVTALAAMKWRIYEELLVADSAEKRIIAHVKATTLAAFSQELQIVLDEGERAAIEAARPTPKEKK